MMRLPPRYDAATLDVCRARRPPDHLRCYQNNMTMQCFLIFMPFHAIFSHFAFDDVAFFDTLLMPPPPCLFRFRYA